MDRRSEDKGNRRGTESAEEDAEGRIGELNLALSLAAALVRPRSEISVVRSANGIVIQIICE